MYIRTTHHRHIKQIITSTDHDKVNEALNNKHKNNETQVLKYTLKSPG